MMNEDRVRTIIESEQYQDLYKRYSLYNKEHEKVERYMAGVRDGMELAIKTFRGREYKDSSCDSCKYVGVKSWEKPCEKCCHAAMDFWEAKDDGKNT